MNPIFTKMVDAVEAANAAPDDYINSADGLKYCGKCRTPKEAFYPADLQDVYKRQLSILLMPILLYSAASLVVSVIFRWIGTVPMQFSM